MQSNENNIDLESLIANYQSLKFNDNKTRIICGWTGHEMPLRVDSVMSYVNGSKYKNLLESKINATDLKLYSEFIVPSDRPNRKNQLFCKLTYKHLNKQPDHIQKHINGKRFQKAYKHWLHCQETGQLFVPFSKRPRNPQGADAEMKSTEENDDNDEDSMSDLFPDDMFDLIQEESNTDKNNNNKKKLNKSQDEEKIDDDNEPSAAVKRKLDSKLNKKHKIEPQRKKAQ